MPSGLQISSDVQTRAKNACIPAKNANSLSSTPSFPVSVFEGGERERERERESEGGERGRNGAQLPLSAYITVAIGTGNRLPNLAPVVHTHTHTVCHTHILACIPALLSSIHRLLGDQLPLSPHSQENWSTVTPGYSGRDSCYICHFHLFVTSCAAVLEEEEEEVAWKLPHRGGDNQ